MKHNEELEDKFQRMTAYKKARLADYGLTMPESELRQCKSGRSLLAELLRLKRRRAKDEALMREMGLNAARFMDSVLARAIAANALLQGQPGGPSDSEPAERSGAGVPCKQLLGIKAGYE